MAKKEKILKISLLIIIFLFIVAFSAFAFTKSIFNQAYTYLLLAALIILFVFIAMKRDKKENLTFEWLNKKRNEFIAIGIIMLFALFIRTVALAYVPAGMMCDEASMLYEAWSLLNYGIDRNGNSWPVYLIAWGGGQNALLTYLTIPFVAMFGMNIISARIASIIISLLTVLTFYFLLKRLSNKKTAFIGMILMAILPWNVMMARWGLESNMLPAFLLFGFFFLIKSVQDNPWWFLLSGFFFGISLYAYATAYVFVPLLLVALYIWMLVTKKIKWKSFIIGNLILSITALPLILFMMVNYGFFEEFKIFGLITIPKMVSFRASEFGFSEFLPNIWHMIKLLTVQCDGLIWNSAEPFGFGLPITFPFVVIGLYQLFRKRKPDEHQNDIHSSIKIWLILSLVVSLFFTDLNINKINYLWIPYFYLIALGVTAFIGNSKKYLIVASSLYAYCSVLFYSCYFAPNYNKILNRIYGGDYMDAVKYAESIRSEEDYIVSEHGWVNYILALVVNEVPTTDYINTVIYEDPNATYRGVVSFTHYIFGLENDTHNGIDAIYVILSTNEFTITGNWQQRSFGLYTVYSLI